MKTLSLICLFCLLATAHGQTIYKTVDEEGKVSYSTTEPNDAVNTEVIAAPQEPSQEDIDAARQRQAELEQSLQKSREKRKARELEEALELENAEKKQQRIKTETNTIPGFMF